MSGNKIKSYLVRFISPVFAVAGFILMLPLTVAAMVTMLVFGFVAMVVLRYRLRNMNVTVVNAESKNQKPPIEGTYSVVDE